MQQQRRSDAFGPNGTSHKSPARSAGTVRMPFAVLQGRIMQGTADGIPADPPPLPGRSQIKRPDRTPDGGHDQTGTVPGFYDSSRWDADHPIVEGIALKP
jgi:hypothetical protein